MFSLKNDLKNDENKQQLFAFTPNVSDFKKENEAIFKKEINKNDFINIFLKIETLKESVLKPKYFALNTLYQKCVENNLLVANQVRADLEEFSTALYDSSEKEYEEREEITNNAVNKTVWTKADYLFTSLVGRYVGFVCNFEDITNNYRQDYIQKNFGQRDLEEHMDHYTKNHLARSIENTLANLDLMIDNPLDKRMAHTEDVKEQPCGYCYQLVHLLNHVASICFTDEKKTNKPWEISVEKLSPDYSFQMFLDLETFKIALLDFAQDLRTVKHQIMLCHYLYKMTIRSEELVGA